MLNRSKVTELTPVARQPDAIDDVILQLSQAGKREDRRRILNQYKAQNEVKVWGEALTVGVKVLQPRADQAWNPKLRAYVDKQLIEDALQTKDPTQPDYKGVSPNYGGGKVEEGRGIGTTTKKMKKLTTVLSKNQKLYSMNQPTPSLFNRKVNLENEKTKLTQQSLQALKQAFIE